MSMPPIHSRIRSRKAPSASRPMPASVPAAPFITLTKSSNSRFSDCMAASPRIVSEGDIGARRVRRNPPAVRVQPPDLVVERGGEAEPGEIRQQEQGSALADPQEQESGDDAEHEHRRDDREGRPDKLQAEEDRRPGVVEEELYEEHRQRQFTSARAAGVEDLGQGEAEADVE